MQSMYDDVVEFHAKFGLPIPSDGPPRNLTPEEFEFRFKFLQEELAEYAAAVRDSNLVKAADALADIVYVALGTAAMQRLPFGDIWTAVQKANMAKVRAVSAAESKRGSALDVVKPAGWVGPEHDIAQAIFTSTAALYAIHNSDSI